MQTSSSARDTSSSTVSSIHRRNNKESRATTSLEVLHNRNNSANHHTFFQPKLQVNKVGDPFEAEADRVADEVTQSIYSGGATFLPPAAPPVSGEGGNSIQRLSFFQRKPAFESPTELDLNTAANPEIQRTVDTSGSAPPQNHQSEEETVISEEGMVFRKMDLSQWEKGEAVRPGFESRLQGSKGGGSPLGKKTKTQMESSFGTDFGEVRIHTDSNAIAMNNQVQAHAFTHGKDIYFNQGTYRPETREGTRLLAHELTHVVQQNGGTTAPVQRSAKVQVHHSTPPMVQRGIISKARNWAARKANHIPGFPMLTVVIGFNPINGQDVPRNAANVFRGIMSFLPGGNLIWEALNKYGIFDKVGNWIVRQLDTLGDIGGALKDAFWEFVDSLSLSDFAPWNIGDLWPRAKGIFMRPINMIKAFLKGLVADIIQFIKDAILKPLAELASRTRAWDLLIAVLGKNPITKETVPQTAENLIGGFMKLIGQDEIWENIQKANAIPRAFAWFKGALSAVVALVSSIPSRFINALKSLTIKDIVILPRAFAKIVGVFAGFAMDFASWAGNAIWELLKIIFSVVAPGAMPFLQRAGAAIRSIFKNPMGFLGNLVQAGKLGFQMFKNRIGSILKEVLIDWLTGTLVGAGVYIPTGLDFAEILKFILSVLGITWENIRGKLVEHLGEGPVVVLEEGFELVQLLVTEGPAAAWEKVMEHLTNLQETVIGEVINWVTKTVVAKAVAKLVTMFIPGAGFIQAILAIWSAIKVFIQRIKKIIEVGVAFMNSIADIVAGNLMPAANKIVVTLKGILVMAVSFFAEFAGLGKVGEALQNILKKIRDPIDQAMDKVILWVKNKAKGFLKKKDDAKHEQIAKAVSSALTSGNGGAKSYEELRAAKEQQARTLEQQYQPQLKEGIGITVSFIEPRSDQEDDDLDFTVRIAPNDTEEKGEIKVPSDKLTVEIGEGTKLSDKTKTSRKTGKRATVTSVDEEKKFVNYSYDAEGGGSAMTSFKTFNERVAEGKIIVNPGEEHTEYFPQNITRDEEGNNTIVTYSTRAGKQFKVTLGSNELVQSIEGFGLQLKDQTGITGRGETEMAPGKPEGDGTVHSSHLIADEFGGSGYASSLNLVAASAHYNTKVMRAAEIEIKNFVKSNKAVEFDLKVDVTWGRLADNKSVEEIVTRLKPDYEISSEDEAQLRAEIISRLSSAPVELKRVMGVTYNVKIKKQSGDSITQVFPIGPDTWLGL